MILKGFEALLLSNGIKCFNRVIGTTDSDESIWGKARTFKYMKDNGTNCRVEQIHRYMFGFTVLDDLENLEQPGETVNFVVLDDLALAILDLGYEDHYIKVDPEVGLTKENAIRAINILKREI